MYWLWNPDPVAFTVGNIGIHWYGLLWALGFLSAQRLVIFMYGKEKKSGRDLDALLMYLLIGTVAGARLIHCLFYDPGYYARNPVSILKIWEGGLSSHGAALGILAALYVFSRRKREQPFFWLVDRIAIVAAIVGGLVRIGNFINSEIIGTPTHCSCGVVFVAPVRNAALASDSSIAHVEIRKDRTRMPAGPGSVPLTLSITLKEFNRSGVQHPGILQRVQAGLLRSREAQANVQWDRLPMRTAPDRDGGSAVLSLTGIARHPVQLYEASVCFLLAIALFGVWWKCRDSTPHGLLLAWFLIGTFGSRFFLEFVKMPVTSGASHVPVSTGQILSIPFALAGLVLLILLKRQNAVPRNG